MLLVPRSCTQFSALGGSLFFQQIELKPKTNPNDAKRRRLGSFWFSTRPTAVRGTDVTSVHCVDYNQCLPLPCAELKTKTNPNSAARRRLVSFSGAVWVRFGFQLDLLEKK